MKTLRRLSRFEKWYQHMRAVFARVDLETLVNVSLVGVTFVWFIWLMIFVP